MGPERKPWDLGKGMKPERGSWGPREGHGD